MRLVFVVLVSMIGLAGCQSVQQSGSPGSCNQASSNVGGTVVCPD